MGYTEIGRKIGGTLLFVTHEGKTLEDRSHDGFDPGPIGSERPPLGAAHFPVQCALGYVAKYVCLISTARVCKGLRK